MSKEDWSTLALKTWKSIPSPWKQAFGLAFLVNIIVFFFELAQFPMGDHDTGFQSGMQLLSGGGAGRWFAPFAYLLVGHTLLPVYSLLLLILCQIAAAMGAVLLWRPHAGTLPLFAAAVIVTCLPFSMEFHYFHGTAPTLAMAQLLMVLGLHLTLSGHPRMLFLPAWLRFASAVVLCTCALALYQSSLMTWTVCYCAYALMQMLEAKNSQGCIKYSIPALLSAAGVMLLACVLYYISLKLYPLVGLSLEMYQVQTVSPSALFSRLLEVMGKSYSHLWTTSHFMEPFVVGIFLCVTVLGFLVIFRQALTKRGWCSVLAIVLLLLLPLASKAQFLFSAHSDWYSGRFSTFGLAYIYAFFMIILLTTSAQRWRNAGFVLLLLAIPAMAVQTINAQAQLVRSNAHDLQVLNRVVAQIEQHENFDPSKTYHLVEFGRFAPYVPPGYTTPITPFWNTLQHHWYPGIDLALVSSSLKLGERVHEGASKRHDLLKKAWQVAKDKPAFPAAGSIDIKDDTIILVFDKQAVDAARKTLKLSAAGE